MKTFSHEIRNEFQSFEALMQHMAEGRRLNKSKRIFEMLLNSSNWTETTEQVSLQERTAYEMMLAYQQMMAGARGIFMFGWGIAPKNSKPLPTPAMTIQAQTEYKRIVSRLYHMIENQIVDENLDWLE